jgi:DNA-binding response OmpR family regulator
MGGFKGMRTIKRTWPKVKIIAMLAGLEEKVNETDALNAARKIGADAQVRKPFTPECLHEVVRALLPSSNLTVELL